MLNHFTLRELIMKATLNTALDSYLKNFQQLDYNLMIIDPMAQTTSINRGIQSVNIDGSKMELELELDRS